MSDDDVITIPTEQHIEQHDEDTRRLDEGTSPDEAPSSAKPPSPAPSLAETVAETVAETKSSQKRARKITSIGKAEFADRLERVNDTYVAKTVGGPLCVLTPPVVLVDGLQDSDSETREYTDLKLKRVYGDVFRDLEDRVLQAAKDRKTVWFNNEDLDDAFLENAMKRFYDASKKRLTVRVDEDVGGRVDLPAGSRVRCVIELHAVVFTRTQFGVLWTLTLVKGVGCQEDVYLFDPEEEPAHQGISTHDLMSCLVHRDLKSSPDEDVDV